MAAADQRALNCNELVMKNLKKLFATMLCLVTVLCTTATAFAAEAKPESATASDPVVAEVTIFSTADPKGSSSLVNDSGHSFISVKNISSSTIGVGKMNVGLGYEITLGTWGNIKQHTGVWYNIESYVMNNIGSYDYLVSLTTTITHSKLDLLNVAIVYTNGWSIGALCSPAAAKLWNTVSDTKLSDGTPSMPKPGTQHWQGRCSARAVPYSKTDTPRQPKPTRY